MSTEVLTDEQKAARVRAYAAHTTGSENLRFHPLGGIYYTDGVAFLASTCGAWWLVDLIGSHQHTPRVRREPFQLWELYIPARRRRPQELVAECWTDTPRGEGSVELARQRIAYSDFPEALAPLRLYAEAGHPGRVLMLPEER